MMSKSHRSFAGTLLVSQAKLGLAAHNQLLLALTISRSLTMGLMLPAVPLWAAGS